MRGESGAPGRTPKGGVPGGAAAKKEPGNLGDGARGERLADEANARLSVAHEGGIVEVRQGLEVTDERVILSGECFFVKVFLKQIGFKWDIEAKEWYILLGDATSTVAADLNAICAEWGLTLTGVTQF